MRDTTDPTCSASPSPFRSELGEALLHLVSTRVSDLRTTAACLRARIPAPPGPVSGTPEDTRDTAALLQLQAIVSDASDDLESWWLRGLRTSDFDFRLPLDLAVRITGFLGTQRRTTLPPALYQQTRDLAISLLFLLSVALARSGEGALRGRASEFKSMLSEAEARLARSELLINPPHHPGHPYRPFSVAAA